MPNPRLEEAKARLKANPFAPEVVQQLQTTANKFGIMRSLSATKTAQVYDDLAIVLEEILK